MDENSQNYSQIKSLKRLVATMAVYFDSPNLFIIYINLSLKFHRVLQKWPGNRFDKSNTIKRGQRPIESQKA